MTGVGGKLLNEKLHDLYCLLNIFRVITSRRMRWLDYVASIGEKSNSYIVLLGESQGKRHLERSRLRREDNIKINLK